jgi:hypothetical protein
MALTNPSWQNNIGYAVEGRMQTVLQKKPLRFGEFYTTGVKTSWRRSSSLVTDMDGRVINRYSNTLGKLYESSKASRRFTLSNGKGLQAQVFTFDQLTALGYLLGNNLQLNFDWLVKALGMPTKAENSYYVQVFEPENDRPWELMLDLDAVRWNPKNYAGYFALNDDEYYTVKAITKIMGKNGPSSFPAGIMGYEICNAGGVPVAAVSTINSGVVHLQDSLPPDERFLMANLCAALLLYEPELPGAGY